MMGEEFFKLLHKDDRFDPHKYVWFKCVDLGISGRFTIPLQDPDNGKNYEDYDVFEGDCFGMASIIVEWFGIEHQLHYIMYGDEKLVSPTFLNRYFVEVNSKMFKNVNDQYQRKLKIENLLNEE